MTDEEQCPGRPQGRGHLWKDWETEGQHIKTQRCLICGEMRKVIPGVE